jgi:hypothetical protein
MTVISGANIQLFNAVLYASAPELFATAYRGSASGMLSALGRIAGIVAPFAGQAYLAADSSGEFFGDTTYGSS